MNPVRHGTTAAAALHAVLLAPTLRDTRMPKNPLQR
jgi:hypothetical protein